MKKHLYFLFEEMEFHIKNGKSAICGSSWDGPCFGGHDVWINNYSSQRHSSSSNFCYSSECPLICNNSNDSWSCGRSYLAGSFDEWLRTEIEVYQLTYSINRSNMSSTLTTITCYYSNNYWKFIGYCCDYNNNYYGCCQNNNTTPTNIKNLDYRIIILIVIAALVVISLIV
jgi:hypothetical protein